MIEWKHTLDIAHLWNQAEGKGGDMSLDNDHYDPTLFDLVEYLESITGHDEATPVEEFDEVWSGFYDWADRNRVWINRASSNQTTGPVLSLPQLSLTLPSIL